jgi:solute carrier family 25 carnitine/acylcarnitine transporter 20/29
MQTDGFALKDRLYSSSIECLRKTVQSDGVAGLYRGFGACMLRAAPVNAMTFVAYEVAMNAMGR